MQLALSKNTEELISSLELVKQINFFRLEEGNKVVLAHSDFLKVIRDEFEEEIGLGNISPSSYTNSQNKEQPMFNLTYDQSFQLLMRESKLVRNAVCKLLKEKTLTKPKTTLDLLKLAVSELEQAEQKLSLQAPIVELANNYLDNGVNMNLSTTAKTLNIKLSELKGLLYSKYITMQRGNEVPYAEYANWFQLKPYVAKNGHKGIQLLITPLGFYKLSKLINK